MSFRQFNLKENTVRALEKQGFKEPSSVQKAVIPKILHGQSLLTQSATGTGKTHAYLAPIVDTLDMNLARPQALVIAPTRELARQIYEFARAFVPFYPKFRVRLFTSESEVTDNMSGVHLPPQLIVGTPGRLKDIFLSRQLYSLRNVKRLVLDEADMLLDLGFFADIEEIASAMQGPQILVFSATLKPNLRDELRKFAGTSFHFENEDTETAKGVRHHLVDIKHGGELNALLTFLSIRKPYLCIVFASTVEKVKEAALFLKENGIDAIYYSGSLDERGRKRALRAIRENKHSVIVSSDLLSRGIDIPDVSDVVSLDLPTDLEFYYHRAGRTGRFGKEGDSWVFYNNDSAKRPQILVDEGVPFDCYVLSKDGLRKDPVGLLPKTKLTKKKELPEEEIREIKIAKALARPKHIEPMYKKKRQFAIEKVKRKYRRKAIQKSIRKNLGKKKED